MKRIIVNVLSVLVVLCLVGSIALSVQAQTPTPASYSVPCFSDGGTSVVAASGCSYHFQSGSTLAVEGNVSMTATNGWAVVTVPTAQATATPGFRINNKSAGAVPLQIEKNATPVAQFLNAGGLTLNTGNLILTAGNATLTLGDLTLTAGKVTMPINQKNFGVPSVESKDVTYGASTGSTGNIWTCPGTCLVHSVLVNVTTNFDCTGDDATLVVGDSGDADGYIVLADAEMQAADTEGTGFPAGWQGLTAPTLGVYLDQNNSSFPVIGTTAVPYTMTFTVGEASGTSLTAGAATVYVNYTRIK